MAVQQKTPCEIFIGNVCNNYGMNTAIDKTPIQGDCYLSPLGFEGDQCASTKVHGGVERALHHYPREHYQTLASIYPKSPAFLQGLGMGENLSTIGMIEENVYIGDRYQLDEAIIEVSQPRSACFKLNTRWQVSDLSTVIQQRNLCGWLYRVIKPGQVRAGSELTFLSRPDSAMSISQVCGIFFHDPLNFQRLEKLATLQGLSVGWQNKSIERLESGVVESWQMRLFGK